MIVKPIIEIVNKNFSQNIEKLVNEYSYPLIIVVINSGVLPLTVYYLSLFEMHYKKSYREKSILIKSFFFLLINSIIIPSLKHDELSLMLSKLKDFNFDKKDFDLFAPFIDNSYFFCRYIIQVTFLTNTLQLFAFPTFFVKKFKFFIANSDFEKVYALVIKKYFDLGFNYSFALIVFLMTLIFSTTIPIIVPFGCLFFYIKYNFDRYNLIFF